MQRRIACLYSSFFAVRRSSPLPPLRFLRPPLSRTPTQPPSTASANIVFANKTIGPLCNVIRVPCFWYTSGSWFIFLLLPPLSPSSRCRGRSRSFCPSPKYRFCTGFCSCFCSRFGLFTFSVFVHVSIGFLCLAYVFLVIATILIFIPVYVLILVPDVYIISRPVPGRCATIHPLALDPTLFSFFMLLLHSLHWFAPPLPFIFYSYWYYHQY